MTSTTKLALAALALVACDAPRGITLWHAYNGAERDALALSADRWNAAHPDRTVELVAVPYAAFADKITSAIPGGNGPDLFIYPQDRIGDWADAVVVEPIEFWIDEPRAARFGTEALAAMAYKGSLYGLPLATKSLAMFYRTDQLPDGPPATTDELRALGAKLVPSGRYAIAYANVDLYGHAPWLFGHGGSIMTDDGTLTIATPEAAAALTFAHQLVIDDYAPEHAEGPQIAALFNEGKAAIAVSGPWFVAEIAGDVPYKVAPLPVVSSTGKHASPFVGAEGILMSSRARDKDAAFEVMDALTSDVAAIERAKLARQVVANVAAYDDPAVAADPVITAFRAQLAHSTPLPKDPAMRTVWTPYKTALGEVLAGRDTPSARLLSLENEVRSYARSPKATK